MELLIRYLDQLPEGDSCIWQGVWVRLPGWLTEEGEKPVRMWTFIWVNPAIDYLHSSGSVHRPDERAMDTPLRELVHFSRKPKHSGCRPKIIEVNDKNLARELSPKLEAAGIEVRYDPELPIIKHVRESMYERQNKMRVGPGLLDGKGVTIEQVRSLAEAAALFYEAAPWEILSADDPILIETTQSPKPLKALSYATVMGGLGESYGLSFHKSYKAFQKMAYGLHLESGSDRTHLPTDLWSILYEPIHELLLLDADLWEDMNLPVAGEDAYPMPICFQPPDDFKRPNSKELIHMEACLRVLAGVTEDEIDSGGFTHEVETYKGPVKLTMSLPMLLEPPSHKQIIQWGFTPDRRSGERVFDAIHQNMEGRDFSSIEDLQAFMSAEISGKTLDDMEVNTDTPQGKARDLCLQAFDSIGRRRRQLARQAIKSDPDCADAYVILAEETPNRGKAIQYYERGVEAGERTLGSERFKKDAGEFWVMHDTRPYMRARAGLAGTLALQGEKARGIEHYWALLDLDTRDCMRLHYELLLVLLQAGRYEEAFRLINKFEDDPQALCKYAHAILLFRRDGDTPKVRQAMRAALKADLEVAEYLLYPGKQPEEHPGEVPDAFPEDEIDVSYADAMQLVNLFEDTPRVRPWLNTELKRFRRRTRRR